MTTSTLQSVDLVQQFQNDSNSRQVDPQIASQPLNHAYPMKRDGIQHDCGAGNFRPAPADQTRETAERCPDVTRGALRRLPTASSWVEFGQL